jgi:hypothetical protein
MLNRYATEKAACKTADFNTKTGNMKISPMQGSKKSGRSGQKIIPGIFTSKYSPFTYQVLKYDTWCNIFCWEHAHYTYVTENRCGDNALHDIDDI